MLIRLLAGLILAVAMTGAAAAEDLALSGNDRWVAVASRQDLTEAISIANTYSAQKPRVVRAQNGWFAVILGPYATTDLTSFERDYSGPPLPPDAVLTRGTSYLETAWQPTTGTPNGTPPPNSAPLATAQPRPAVHLAAQAPSLLAGVGDIVLRVETSEPLPNIFGGADIFGRRRPTGTDILQFAGLRGNKAVFIRTGVSIQSNATTLTESPRYVPLNRFSTFSGNVGTTQFYGSGTSTGGVWVPPRGSQSTATQLPGIEIEVDWQQDPVIVVSGKRLVIHAVTATTVSYSVE